MFKKSSVSIARNRLRVLVTSDRIQCDPANYDNICRELYAALSKYMELTEDEFDVEISRNYIRIKIAGEEM